jgi:hypothetical protein
MVQPEKVAGTADGEKYKALKHPKFDVVWNFDPHWLKS